MKPILIFLLPFFLLSDSAWPQFRPDFGRRVDLDVIREKRTRKTGGDFDDKMDAVALRLKFHNTDTTNGYEGFTGRVIALSESVTMRNVFKVTIVEDFEIDLEPREKKEITTKTVHEGWDNTYAKWGFRYEGWLVLIRDKDGKNVTVKSTSPRFEKVVDGLDTVKEEMLLDGDMREYNGKVY